MSNRFALILYLITVVAVTFIHHPGILIGLLGFAIVAAGKRIGLLLSRALIAIIIFNLIISLSYFVMALWQGYIYSDYLLVVNIRVILLAFLGFWLIATVNLFAILADFPVLRLIATLAVSQIKTFERILEEFRLAFQSRNLASPSWLARVRHSAAQPQALLDKSIASANETALAMRSRGAFDD